MKAHTVLCLALLAALASSAVATKNPTANSTHVMARIELDNTEKEVNKSLTTLKKNIAKELCGVPETDVTIWKVMKDDTKVLGVGNTQTLVYAACKAPNSKLEAVRDDCEDWWNQHQAKDETKDKTSWWSGGELEIDDISCDYVEGNKFALFSKADRAKAQAQGSETTASATTTVSAEKKNAAAGVAASVTAGAALAGAAVLLML